MGAGDSLNSIRDGLLSLAYPSECRLCGASIESWGDGVACARCWSDPEITPLFRAGSVCLKCGIPIAINPAGNMHGDRAATLAENPIPARDYGVPNPGGQPLCGGCDGFPIRFTRACGAYAGALQASVLFLKTHPHVCTRLRGLLGNIYRDNREQLASDIVIPVPLHRVRKKERGFNQAMVLARVVARVAGLSVDSTTLERIKQTKRHRAGMDVADRARSVQNAFHASSPEKIKNRTVLLVDDVFTTGSTLGEAATALLEGGAASVNCLTIGRVLLPPRLSGTFQNQI
ncbi:MAG TPA: phosphoribosyltransferase family protein [Blastocatellia bacterium]|nr:phosphoribosyltransferase family protein [Blastocatellia bacterium]